MRQSSRVLLLHDANFLREELARLSTAARGGQKGWEPGEFMQEVLESVTEAHGHVGPSGATWNPRVPVRMVCTASPWGLNQELGAQERAGGSQVTTSNVPISHGSGKSG